MTRRDEICFETRKEDVGAAARSWSRLGPLAGREKGLVMGSDFRVFLLSLVRYDTVVRVRGAAVTTQSPDRPPSSG